MAHTKGTFYHLPRERTDALGLGKHMVASVGAFDVLSSDHPGSFESEDNAKLFATAPDLLTALKRAEFEIHNPGTNRNDRIDIAEMVRTAIAKAEGNAAPAGWAHAETHAPDSLPFPTQAAHAVEQHIDEAREDMSLTALLAAIIRRAERAKSYGKVMITSKDLCIDDVIKLANRALKVVP